MHQSYAGSSVALTLYFLRFGLEVNIVQLALWKLLVVLPFLLAPPPAFSWSLFLETRPADLLQGYGLADTFLVYGALFFHLYLEPSGDALLLTDCY